MSKASDLRSVAVGSAPGTPGLRIIGRREEHGDSAVGRVLSGENQSGSDFGLGGGLSEFLGAQTYASPPPALDGEPGWAGFIGPSVTPGLGAVSLPPPAAVGPRFGPPGPPGPPGPLGPGAVYGTTTGVSGPAAVPGVATAPSTQMRSQPTPGPSVPRPPADERQRADYQAGPHDQQAITWPPSGVPVDRWTPTPSASISAPPFHQASQGQHVAATAAPPGVARLPPEHVTSQHVPPLHGAYRQSFVNYNPPFASANPLLNLNPPAAPVSYPGTGHVPHGSTSGWTVPSEIMAPMATHLGHKTVTNALNGEFVDLTECIDSFSDAANDVKSSVDEYGNVSIKSVKSRKNITNAFKWFEAWGHYEYIMARSYGFEVYQEMATYRAFMVNLFQRFKAPFVLMYDVRHRSRLAASRSLKFSHSNYGAFLMSFDQASLRVNANRCTRCSALDHDQADCPFRDYNTREPPFLNKGTSRDVSSEVCHRFQTASCRLGKKCKRRHVCIACGGPEGAQTCATCASKTKSSV